MESELGHVDNALFGRVRASPAGGRGRRPRSQTRPARRHDQKSKVKRSLVCVVDDDESVRESLPDLLREFGFDAAVFSSAEEFLASGRADACACLILDIAMPGMSGPELLAERGRRGWSVPIVFITANFDEAVRSRLLLQGAAACLFKPFSAADLLAALDAAMPTP